MELLPESGDDDSRTREIERIRITVDEDHTPCPYLTDIVSHEKSSREEWFECEIDPTREIRTVTEKCRLS